MKYWIGSLLFVAGLAAGYWLHGEDKSTNTATSVSTAVRQSKEKPIEYSISSEKESSIPETITDTEINNEIHMETTGADEQELPSVIRRLIIEGSILPEDLGLMKYWYSYDEFERMLSELKLGVYEYHSLLAKAQSLFQGNFAKAIEELYNARKHTRNKMEEDLVEGQIEVVSDYLSNQYFQPYSRVSQSQFLDAMYLLFEKKPGNVQVIIALIKHHLLMHDFELVETYIDSIPEEPKNEALIDLYRYKLNKTQNMSKTDDKGIPLIKRGNHFVVPVNFSDDAELNLLIDTGASKTTLSARVIYSLMKMSPDVKDLKLQAWSQTANGKAAMRFYQTDFIKVGDYVYNEPVFLSANMEVFDKIYGLLGMDFLGRFQFRIDHEKQRLYLSY